jgi:acyl-homoserine lactone acylase PvdQ
MHLSFDHFFFSELAAWDRGENLDAFYCQGNDSLTSNASCLAAFYDAFVEANNHLYERLGADRTQWLWGRVNRHTFIHSPFSSTPLKSFFERHIESRGNRRTINVAGVNLITN